VAQRFTAAMSGPFSVLALAAEGDCGAHKECFTKLFRLWLPIAKAMPLARVRLDRMALFTHLLQEDFDRHLKLVPEQIDECVVGSGDVACESR
jgi:hypothetical protein